MDDSNFDNIVLVALGFIAGALVVHIIHTKQQTQTLHNLAPSIQPITEQYKNNEKWEIERDGNESIKTINVIRDAKIANQKL